MFCRHPPYTCRISIALAIRSLDPTLGLGCAGFRRFYTHSAPLGLLEAGGISIALPSRSLDRSGAPYKMVHGFHLDVMIEICFKANCATTNGFSNKL